MTNPTPDEAFDRYRQAVLECIEGTRDAMTPIAQAVAEFLVGAGEKVSPIADVVQVLSDGLSVIAWDAYRRAGLPYGDTEDGLLAWLDSEGDEAQREADAKYQCQRQWMIDGFRRQVEERGTNRPLDSLPDFGYHVFVDWVWQRGQMTRILRPGRGRLCGSLDRPA